MSPWQNGAGRDWILSRSGRANTVRSRLTRRAGQAADRDYVVRLLPNDDSLYVLEVSGVRLSSRQADTRVDQPRRPRGLSFVASRASQHVDLRSWRVDRQ
ncbi:MAG: hypothetical protein R3B96_02825 [Pirellulaceae bacterium]